ncbi:MULTISPECIES: GNAT family N-acetyltransferase/peptidase C39 family protein [Alteromonas]|jgi:ribosomal protein S18 acetylase RimI-like enzyme|uniref:GNAT family N-acetyltransferase/peptidase C39 family protein n=1 Tax=Alteromonas TaxID=226 RepID=UPI001284750C|nr:MULTISPECIES: GNAT family N-acetyltransferase/peptidase C39 family protein [Alteromonas]CAI2389452.1 Ribosomal protein S18 acetylase RimI [Alteromonas macleodii]CAI3944971.1 Ribosomal protein S18 acetylase RimI [Alteromonas macleodii]CAI3945946.1 Ribosomal protein S18 acetylase RimI [Alteromonas macleodii]CAI3946014.1 Ribosomal protein S18 acetylase RimI [Alteromonas macleodii]VTO39048.1 Ribosomal protein S18 acetylase RimI [Alteromonas macleodii]|tara:strand:+ start:573 stop:1847 length:1275 start_codon:yes stop_codon:yes gene_type:complete
MITSAERVTEVNSASPLKSVNSVHDLTEGASIGEPTKDVVAPSTQSNVVLRVATLQDLASLQHIEQTCFTTDRLSKSRFKFYIDAQHAELIVAEREPSSENAKHDKNKQGVNSIVGYGLLLLRRGTQLTRLYSIAVLPEARGLGVAEKLINSLGERALLRGKRFMRLEVAVGNAGAIALYKKLGFSQFGMYTDYYDDHTDALRMQKVLVPSKSVKPEIYPWYQQTTDFTCGPSALMMAMCALNNRYEMTQEKELSLWRTATTIFMMSGHGGCHPVGLALAAVNEGYAAKVVINRDVPLFVDGVRDANKKEIVENVEQQFMAEARKKGISVEISDWRVDVIDQTLKAGGAVLCLISTYAFDKKKVPHWVAITSCDSHCYYLHDPDASEGQPVEYQHIPVAREDFLRLASYGTRKVRTLVLLKKKK